MRLWSAEKALRHPRTRRDYWSNTLGNFFSFLDFEQDPVENMVAAEIFNAQFPVSPLRLRRQRGVLLLPKTRVLVLPTLQLLQLFFDRCELPPLLLNPILVVKITQFRATFQVRLYI